jgi:uncharacterized protein YbjQ (UPF0145 family)
MTWRQCELCENTFEVAWGSPLAHCRTCNESEHEANATPAQKLEAEIEIIPLTTTLDFPEHEIERTLEIITAECVFGMNLFRDMFAGIRDIFGGRSSAAQKVLKDSRLTCLYELKKEAYEIGADGVIGVDLDYSEFSGGGKSMLFLVASGTAVKFKK